MMSLVNDMLRDLAARQQADHSTASENDALLQQSSLLQKKRYNWVPSVAVFVGVVLVVSVAQIVLQKNGEQPPSVQTEASAEVPALVSDAPVAEKSVTEEQVNIAQPSVDRTVSEDAVSVNSEPQHAAQQNTIYRLLQRAERALTLDRLTAPVEDNAYGYFQEILTLSPGNQPAVEGLQRIAGRYLALAQDAHQRGEYQRAETLLQRADFVAPGYAAIAQLREQLREQPAAMASAQAVETGNDASAQEKENAEERASVSVETLPVAEAAIHTRDIDIQPNPAWQDQQMVIQADALIAQGNDDAAVLALQQFVAQHQQPRKSAVRLFDLYIQQRNNEAARLLLHEANDYLSVTDHTRLTAQLLTAQGQHAAALAVLEKKREQATQDESYRALLAALYHKAARYQESANHYRRLLDNFGEKPAYWLGLALALDALQQHASALEAYRRIGLQDAQPQVKEYVAQRIAALSH
jgi:MSHA biogenesis protein MshN